MGKTVTRDIVAEFHGFSAEDPFGRMVTLIFCCRIYGRCLLSAMSHKINAPVIGCCGCLCVFFGNYTFWDIPLTVAFLAFRIN